MAQLNGSVSYKNRTFSIYWSGEMAQHVATNFITDPTTHPYLHLSIQKMLQKCKKFVVVKNSVMAYCKDGEEKKMCCNILHKNYFCCH